MSTAQPYESYYWEQLGKGVEFQDYVHSLLYDIGIVVVQYQSRRFQFERGENSGGIEIKFDDRIDETGNLYIETAEKANPLKPHFVPSGIYRLDNGWMYAIGNYSRVYLFVTRHLRWLHERHQFKEIETPTSRGFLLPEVIARKYAARILARQGRDEFNCV